MEIVALVAASNFLLWYSQFLKGALLKDRRKGNMDAIAGMGLGGSKSISTEETASRDPYEIVARFLVGFLVNFLMRKLRERREIERKRRKAARKVAKLEKKGKSVPEELRAEALKGLSKRRARKRVEREKKRTKRRRRRVFALLAILALFAVVFAMRRK